MANNPPAPDLGAIRARLSAWSAGNNRPYLPHEYGVRVDVAALLAAYDAQGREIISTARRDSDRLFQVVTLESALRLAQDKLDAQTARLAAVEEAARAWASVFTDAPAQEPWFSPWQALRDAVANLATPLGALERRSDV